MRALLSRRLPQKVARSLHFKRILMSREDHLRRAVFQAPKLGLLLNPFSLGPPFAEFQKMADLGHFAQFARTLLCGPLLEPLFAVKRCSIIAL